jgi:hypothetical protein
LTGVLAESDGDAVVESTWTVPAEWVADSAFLRRGREGRQGDEEHAQHQHAFHVLFLLFEPT